MDSVRISYSDHVESSALLQLSEEGSVILEYFEKELEDNNQAVVPSRPRHHLAGYLLRAWTALKPTYFETGNNKRLQSTSWLDGVRGIAAFLVVTSHLQGVFHSELSTGWQFGMSFWALPIFRMIYSGASCVSVFFVISGYALSYKAFQQARQDDVQSLFSTLTSSTFRRAWRLYLPCAFMTFIAATTSWVGLYDKGYRKADTFGGQMWLWLTNILYDISPFDVKNTLPGFEATLWTIPYEYRGSFVVFLTTLVLSRFKQRMRLVGLLMSLSYLTWTGTWDCFLFTSGMLCCELHLIRREHNQENLGCTAAPVLEVPLTASQRAKAIFRAAVKPFALVMILFVLSQPEPSMGNGVLHIYDAMDYFRPPSWKGQYHNAGQWWRCVSALSLILLIDNWPACQKMLNCRFPQYLGEVSFSLYLVHSYLVHSVAVELDSWVQTLCQAILPWSLMFWIGRFLSFGIFLIIIFWAADLMMRHVDKRSVRFAKWIETKCFKEQDDLGSKRLG